MSLARTVLVDSQTRTWDGYLEVSDEIDRNIWLIPISRGPVGDLRDLLNCILNGDRARSLENTYDEFESRNWLD